MPSVLKYQSTQDECSKENLWIFMRKILERRKDQRNQGKSNASLKTQFQYTKFAVENLLFSALYRNEICRYKKIRHR